MNASASGNIFSSESDECRNLLEEYFTSSQHAVESDSESEEDEDETTDVDHETDTGSDMEDEPPVVSVENGLTKLVEVDGDQDSNSELYRQARDFSCRCTQIKVVPVEGTPEDSRRGCIRQFHVREVVDIDSPVSSRLGQR